MYPSLLHKMAQFCMNIAKKSSGGGLRGGKKLVAVENKYSVHGLPGNKFSGRARDENK